MKPKTQIIRKELNYSKIIFKGKIGEMYKSTAYKDFNFININRAVDETTKKFKTIFAQLAIDKEMLWGFGVVDKYGNIADGQHRLVICQKLGIPFKFILVERVTLEMIKIINNTQKAWNYMTTCYSEIAAGNNNYKKYLAFRTNTPALKTHTIWKMFLSQKPERKSWKDGLYKAGDMSNAYYVANMYIPIIVYLKGRQQIFAEIFMAALLHPNGAKYNQKRFLTGLEGYTRMIESRKNKNKIFTSSKAYKTLECPQIKEECKQLINEIWNYGQEPSEQSDLLPKN